MTLDELFEQVHPHNVYIHIPVRLYEDCIAWLHTQSVRWNSGHRFNNASYSCNHSSDYGENTVLRIERYNYTLTIEYADGLLDKWYEYE